MMRVVFMVFVSLFMVVMTMLMMVVSPVVMTFCIEEDVLNR